MPAFACRLSIVAVALAVSAVATLDGRAPSAQQRYEAARTREAQVRAAAEKVAPSAPTPEIDEVVRPVRRVMTDYENLVRRYPTSGYSDNALLQAAGLSQFLYSRFGRSADRVTAENYYGWLIREYPTSRFRAQARTAVRTLAVTVPASRIARSATAPAAASTVTPPPSRPVPVPAPAAADGAAAPRAAVSPSPLPTPGVPAIATLHAVDRAVLDTAVRITLSLDRETPFSHERLDGPPRAFIDLFGATVAESLVDAVIPVDGDAVRQVRVGQRAGAARVVLDLDGATPVSVFTLYNPYRIVIDAERKRVATPVAATAPVVPVAVDAAPSVQLVDEGELDIMPAVAVATDAALAAAPAPAPEVPDANTDGTFSLSRQLGLGISRIVIDPGHGGHDPGTLTPGSSEARLVLDVALRLEKLLVAEGFDVVLTRRTNVFVPLEQRPAIANREGADLFLSIHANASRNRKARGVEVYYLSFASNPEAEAVAARENSTSAGGMHNLPGIVRAIALNNKLDESRDLAGMVQKALASHLARSNAGLPNRGVKKAPFVVLIGAQMPAILAEIGFITNQQEAALIKTPAYRQKIAESLQAAVLQYQRALKRQTAVATR